jgi:hypothetical protein
MPVVILMTLNHSTNEAPTSDMSRFYAEERPDLMSKLTIAPHGVGLHGHHQMFLAMHSVTPDAQQLQQKPKARLRQSQKCGRDFLSTRRATKAMNRLH